MFKNLDKMPVLLLSKVGDNSIDIPEANVIIQISSHAGSRRQEAQRLGRILRPKSRQASLGPRPPNEYDAFFYSLVSTDTVEMYFSTKRQQFLVDQGYAFKVVPDLLDHVDVSGLQLASHADQTALLSKVLVVGAEDAGEEMLPADEDAIDTGVPLARRFERRAYDLSGAPRGLGYAEYTKSGGSAPLPRLGGGGSGSGALRRQQGPFAASERTHHSLLKDRYGGGKR
jgi:DNA excision repair protein ERCC-3